MNRTECTLMDAANKIEKEFLLIGLPIRLEDFLTSEEYETFRFALKGILPNDCEENWNVINRVYQKVNKLAADGPMLELTALSAMSKNSKSKSKLIGFESSSFDFLIKKVNEFISSDECKEFINFDFKTTDHNINDHHSRIVYSGFIEYRGEESDEEDSQKRRDDVKEFASEVRKTIENTFKNFGGSEHFSFADHGLDLIEAVQNKLDEVLK